MKYVTTLSIAAEIIDLVDDTGYARIKQAITPALKLECRLKCKEEYKMKNPLSFNSLVPEDLDLGSSSESAAESCVDLRDNGPGEKADIYWI